MYYCYFMKLLKIVKFCLVFFILDEDFLLKIIEKVKF